MKNLAMHEAATPRDGSHSGQVTIFELLTTYHRSLDAMRVWLSEHVDDEVERIAIADAWQEEMRAYFRAHGYCFACNRPIPRCTCDLSSPE